MRRRLLPFALLAVLVPTALDAQPAKTDQKLADGLAALAKSDYPEAEKTLSAVTGAAESDAKAALARAYLEQGKFADAEKAANASKGAKGTVVKGEILAAQGKYADAIRTVEALSKGSAKGVDVRRARLLHGQWLIETGKRKDADDPLQNVIADYNDPSANMTDAESLAQVGRAAFFLRSAKDANTAYKESEKADRKKENVETFLWASELFFDKYDPGHAEDELKDALKAAPHRADALVAMARVKLDQSLDFDAAEKLIKEALAVNPKHTGAFAVRAGLALRDMDITGAEKAIAEGLAINPADLELLSLRAASRFLDDDKPGYEQAKSKTLAANSEYSRMFGIVGEFAEWEHRYDDIITMQKEAVKIDPQDAKAWSELGLTQMRAGEEDAGLDSIRKAWDRDHFNVRVFNTLNMYEKDIPAEYEMGNDGVFKIRYAKDEKPILERYVPRMLGEAWASMKSRYGFVPTVPVQIEMYASRQQFSIRTSGLPNIGIQGVCFGHMIAAISPKAEPFNWGNVLWHELGHVFAIQLSKNHVPRWFTEGLSEYETIARRPEWARELDPQLYEALISKKLPAAVDMNRAFTHAEDAEDVTVAYYAASQMMIWTVERFGMGGVQKALKLWGEGKRTPDVIKGAFGVTPEEYDKGFRDWALGRLGRYKDQYRFKLKGKDIDEAKKDLAAKPSDPTLHVVMALSYLHGRKGAEAKKELEEALKLDPKNPDAHFVSAKLSVMEKDVPGAEKHLEAIRAAGKDGYELHEMLADLAEAAKDKEKMRFHLEAAHRLDPSQPDPLKGLYDMAHDEKREGDELPLLEKLAQLEQHDHKIWRLLLEKYVTLKRWDDARRIGEGAVFVDVNGGPTHMLYAKALSAQNAHEKAAFELETATMTKMKNPELASAHALLAAELVALKKPADAKKHLEQAVKLDPDNADAKAVKVP